MRLAVLIIAATLLLDGCASADKPDGRAVQLVADRVAVQGCELLTLVKDNDVDDLKKKAAEEGGNTALVTGQTGADTAFIVKFSRIKFIAEVYRCP